MAYTDYTWVVVDKQNPPKGYSQPVLDLADMEYSIAKYWNGAERRFSIDAPSFKKLFESQTKMTIRVSDITTPGNVSVQFLAYDPNEQSNDYILFKKNFDNVNPNDPEPDGFMGKNIDFNSVLVRIGTSLNPISTVKFAIFVQGAKIVFTENKVSGTTNVRTGGGTPAGSSTRIPQGT